MNMDAKVGSPFAGLKQRFANSLGAGRLSDPQQDFLNQILEDLRPEEVPELDAAGLAAILGDFWRFAEARPGADPGVRLVPAGPGGNGPGLELLEIAQDDAPFLVDSIMGELSQTGQDIRAMVHPVVRLGAAGGPAQSLILVVLGAVGEDRRQALLDGVTQVLAEARAAVRDFPAMLTLMRRTAEGLHRSPSPPRVYPVEEHLAFIDWLSQRFVFLGARAYDYVRGADGRYAHEEPETGPGDSLGVLRDQGLSVLRRDSEPGLLAPDLDAYYRDAPPIVTAKSNLRSRVHRRTHMDYVGIRRYDAAGVAVGEVRFVGLFTVEAYEEAAREIPLLRRKIAHVLARAGAQPSQHNAKRFRYIVETFPRDELFQVEEDALYEIATAVSHLYDRPRVRLLTRPDAFDRFVSCLLFVPRERYGQDVSRRAGALLARAYGGRVSAAYSTVSDQALARLHFIIGVTPGAHPTPDPAVLEAGVAEVVRTWADRFEALVRGGAEPADRLAQTLARYAQAFPPGYRDAYDAQEAVADLKVIEASAGSSPLCVRAYRCADDARTQFRFKLYRPREAVPLAEVLPILDNMGLKAMTEQGFALAVGGPDAGPAAVTWVHEFLLEDARGERLSFAEVRQPFEDTFLAVWTDRTESDGFNRLVLELGAGWREVALLRALARYRQQSGLDPSQTAQETALRDHAEIARLVLDMFQIKFDPALAATPRERTDQAEAVFGELTAALQAVASLDDDRVLRRMALLVRALTRTNFYQRDPDGHPKPRISFKVASRELDHLPAPKPYREIYVSAPDVEGVHLRFGPVARGGLRWSDRRDDFRTEVLGLAKAQQVKNAVIVPVGSKGGFYPKRLPRGGSADAIRAEGVGAYRTFLSGLLDITDNLDAEGRVIRPAGVIVHEPDDPYLVVAADKGTATFSDIANGVAADYGFWLGDAFASGGSVGYDHKAMAITARGCWEAVKRHFRELGKDISSQPFTCVGVGDMSGDVFGNGALLSRAMRLVAAFDHRHIFLDPDPDPERSWVERRRLFDLPRSSWDDYDREVLSPGGGVYPRDAKEVRPSAQARALLDLEADVMAPVDLIRAILKARVELLYLGGIGTYVKAAAESQAQVGDKANDAVRIDAGDLRCRVVGEGANLGFTQAARIAFARGGNGGAGGRIDTDAIDNSAGVDTSDHEVNIKILLGQAERAGALAAQDRSALLAAMTHEVAAHVLAHNEAQTLGLSLQAADAVADLDAHGAFMAELEGLGRLDRRLEGLPSTADLTERRAQDQPLTRPELAVLTAYAKLELSAEIVAGDAPDDPYFAATLKAYFPTALGRFSAEMQRHRLRREIIATVLANRIVDMAGPTYPTRLMAATACDAATLVRAFEAARQVFRFDETWREIQALEAAAPAAVLTPLYREVSLALRSQTFSLARQAARRGVQAMVDAYRPEVDRLRTQAAELSSSMERASAQVRRSGFVEAGAPEALATAIADLPTLGGAVEIVDLAGETGRPVDATARLYAAVGSVFGFDRLRAAAAAIRPQDGYERTALRGLATDLVAGQIESARAVALQAPAAAAGDPDLAAAEAIQAWIAARPTTVARARTALERLEQTADRWTFAKLTLAAGALRGLREAEAIKPEAAAGG